MVIASHEFRAFGNGRPFSQWSWRCGRRARNAREGARSRGRAAVRCGRATAAAARLGRREAAVRLRSWAVAVRGGAVGGTERGSRLDPAPAPQALAPGVAERRERAERAAAGRAGWGFLGVAVQISRIDSRLRKNVAGRAGWGFLGVAVQISRIDSRLRKNVAGRAGWGFLGVAVQISRNCNSTGMGVSESQMRRSNRTRPSRSARTSHHSFSILREPPWNTVRSEAAPARAGGRRGGARGRPDPRASRTPPPQPRGRRGRGRCAGRGSAPGSR